MTKLSGWQDYNPPISCTVNTGFTYHRIALIGKQKRISCIPEGEYILPKQFSPKFKWHLHLMNVPGRDLILIHPGNDAKKELLGCIATVTKHTGIGKGSSSRKALEKLKTMVYVTFDQKEFCLVA